MKITKENINWAKNRIVRPGGEFWKLRYAPALRRRRSLLRRKRFGLRAGASNLEMKSLQKPSPLRPRKASIYVTLNMIPHNDDLVASRQVHALKAMGVDAVLVVDPGVFAIVRETELALKVSISTPGQQYQTGKPQSSGIIRSLALCWPGSSAWEMQTIVENNSRCGNRNLVHGAMCIPHSKVGGVCQSLHDRP